MLFHCSICCFMQIMSVVAVQLCSFVANWADFLQIVLFWCKLCYFLQFRLFCREQYFCRKICALRGTFGPASRHFILLVTPDWHIRVHSGCCRSGHCHAGRATFQRSGRPGETINPWNNDSAPRTLSIGFACSSTGHPCLRLIWVNTPTSSSSMLWLIPANQLFSIKHLLDNWFLLIGMWDAWKLVFHNKVERIVCNILFRKLSNMVTYARHQKWILKASL